MSLISYIRETRAELKHVSWPTKKQAISYTFIVIIFSLAVALYLGLLDFIFSIPLKEIL